MNEEIKAQWVAALRSGEYVQGRGSLHSVDESGTSVMKWVGLENNAGRLPRRNDDEGALYLRNDSGCSFSEIADVIEEEF